MMRVGLHRLGQWTQETEYPVDAARTTAYAAATNDPHPLHTGGVIAPPLFAVVPVGEHIALALDGVVSDEDQRWGLHAEQDMFFHHPIIPGMTLRTRAAPIGVEPKTAGTRVVIKTATRDEDARLLVEQYVTLFFRRKFAGPAAGERAPDHRTPSDAKTAATASGQIMAVSDALDEGQTFRYADASGDRNPIHLDPEVAASVGLPGIIVHGMCTMAFAGWAVVATVCGDVPQRLRRLAVRFARPVLPGQTITTRIWPAGGHAGRAAYAFETLNPDGKAVLLDGLAEVEKPESVPPGHGG